MIETVLFAFALAHMPDYAREGCAVKQCVTPTIVTTSARPAAPVAGTRALGWTSPNMPNVIFINEELVKGSPMWEEVAAHEIAHNIQNQLNKYPGYIRGNPCDQYYAEAEAYEVSQARLAVYGLTRKDIPKLVANYQLRCDAARRAGLVK